MSSFTTIMIVSLPSELLVPKSLLDAHEIEYQTVDELTIQVDNFLSNAMGGVKLQVKPDDVERAQTLLREAGFMVEEVIEPDWITLQLAKPRFKKRFKLAMYALFSVIGVLLIMFAVNWYIQRPTTSERLMYRDWCLVQMDYGEESYEPYTTGPNQPKFRISWECYELLVFGAEGDLTIPGFGNAGFKGKWALEGDQVRIYDLDSLGKGMEGLYDMELDKNYLVLESDYVRFYCDGSRRW